MKQSTELRQVVKERFYPFAERQGFTRVKSTNPLFTVFRRQRQTVHVFDLQWDKYHHPRFVINFGEAPVEGGEAPPMTGRLQRRRGGSLGCWFQLRKPSWEAVSTLTLRYSPAEVVEQAIVAFPELEEWWATRAEGPHIYIWQR